MLLGYVIYFLGVLHHVFPVIMDNLPSSIFNCTKLNQNSNA